MYLTHWNKSCSPLNLTQLIFQSVKSLAKRPWSEIKIRYSFIGPKFSIYEVDMSKLLIWKFNRRMWFVKMKVYYSVGVVGKETVSPHQYYRLMLLLHHKLILTAQAAACSEHTNPSTAMFHFGPVSSYSLNQRCVKVVTTRITCRHCHCNWWKCQLKMRIQFLNVLCTALC